MSKDPSVIMAALMAKVIAENPEASDAEIVRRIEEEVFLMTRRIRTEYQAEQDHRAFPGI
jgi:hypothetical protein